MDGTTRKDLFPSLFQPYDLSPSMIARILFQLLSDADGNSKLELRIERKVLWKMKKECSVCV